jgi:hypothetical protein
MLVSSRCSSPACFWGARGAAGLPGGGVAELSLGVNAKPVNRKRLRIVRYSIFV